MCHYDQEKSIDCLIMYLIEWFIDWLYWLFDKVLSDWLMDWLKVCKEQGGDDQSLESDLRHCRLWQGFSSILLSQML